MLPNEQMVEAASEALRHTGIAAPQERANIALDAAFAVLDHAALIEAGAIALLHSEQRAAGHPETRLHEVVGAGHYLAHAEAVLRAVGLLP